METAQEAGTPIRLIESGTGVGFPASEPWIRWHVPSRNPDLYKNHDLLLYARRDAKDVCSANNEGDTFRMMVDAWSLLDLDTTESIVKNRDKEGGIGNWAGGRTAKDRLVPLSRVQLPLQCLGVYDPIPREANLFASSNPEIIASSEDVSTMVSQGCQAVRYIRMQGMSGIKAKENRFSVDASKKLLTWRIITRSTAMGTKKNNVQRCGATSLEIVDARDHDPSIGSPGKNRIPSDTITQAPPPTPKRLGVMAGAGVIQGDVASASSGTTVGEIISTSHTTTSYPPTTIPTILVDISTSQTPRNAEGISRATPAISVTSSPVSQSLQPTAPGSWLERQPLMSLPRNNFYDDATGNGRY